MNSRRKFLVQGTMATTVLLAAKPMNALAKYSSPLLQKGFTYHSITLLHTTGQDLAVMAEVKKIRNKTSSLVVLHGEQNKPKLNYDASLQSIHEGQDDLYKIIDKDNTRVGIITARANEHELVNQVNELSAYLKNEKGCKLVVCISELGFKNKTGLDDLALAGKSEHLDIIVASHAANSPKEPIIARNRKKAEVIIQHTSDGEKELAKIRIGFNQHGNKHHVSF